MTEVTIYWTDDDYRGVQEFYVSKGRGDEEEYGNIGAIHIWG